MTAARHDDQVGSGGPSFSGPVSVTSLVERTGSGVDPPQLQLVASVDPRVVFASLAAACVTTLCDDCMIDIVDGTDAHERIRYPPRTAPAGDLGGLIERAAATADHVVQVQFNHPPLADAAHGHDDGPREGFHGVATFVWRWRTATRADRTMAGVLVGHAVRTVVWQRSEQALHAAAAAAENLKIALQTNRNIGTAIGILMTLHKTTQDQAFELLLRASQHRNRKLRDLALDVIDTGCLDPA